MERSYKRTLTACYLGFVTQAISANFAPLLYLTFHRSYGIPLGRIAMISTVFFLTQLVVDILCGSHWLSQMYSGFLSVFGRGTDGACGFSGASGQPLLGDFAVRGGVCRWQRSD